jgi:hypothetical protein
MNAPFSNVTIVAMTANVQKNAMDQCHAVGMNDYLQADKARRAARHAESLACRRRESLADDGAAARAAANVVIDKAYLAELRSRSVPMDRVTAASRGPAGLRRAAARGQRGTDMAEIVRLPTLKGAAINTGASHAQVSSRAGRRGTRSSCGAWSHAGLRIGPGATCRGGTARGDISAPVPVDRATRNGCTASGGRRPRRTLALRETLLGEATGDRCGQRPAGRADHRQHADAVIWTA